MTLREEVRDWGNVDGDRPVTWQEAREAWRAYILDREDIAAVFEHDDGTRVTGSDPHRFAPEYGEKQYAKLKDLERGLADEYGKRLHTAMLTFTASAKPGDRWLPPVDHLDRLDESKDAVRRALDRCLDGKRFERLAILEPHPGDGVNNGYLHIHMAVFVDGKITREDLAPVIEAHVRNCDLAGWDAHDLDDDETISVRHAGHDRDLDDDDQLDELAIYLAEYLGCYGDEEGPLDQPEHVQASNALLWAAEAQRWRPSNGAQEYMAQERSDDALESPWSFVGVEDANDEFHEVSGDAGGVSRFTTSWDPPDRGGPG